MLSLFALCQYGIVLDAGSSHTSIYVYRWPADKQNGTGVVTQHSECKVKGQRMQRILSLGEGHEYLRGMQFVGK